MRKWLKISLIIISVLIGIIILDTIQALVFNNNILIGFETKCMTKHGIFVDTYHCDNGNITKIKKANVCYYDDVCGKESNEIKLSNWSKDNVTMSVKDISIDKAILVIEDKNEEPINWNTYYTIQKLSEADVWYDLKANGSMESLMGVSAPNEDGITEIELNWKDKYGELNGGTYRIVKKKDFITLYGEPFEIN